MKNRWILLGSILAVLLVGLAAGLTQAQGPEPPEESVQPQDVGVEAIVDNVIPIQGRLTDASGTPLNGTYRITATIYTSGGTALCSDGDSVNVSNGLFQMNMDFCTSAILNGQQLYLGIKVGTDAEMADRQPIYPVPYAFSLRPGAIISDTRTSAVLNVYNHGNSWGVDAYSKGHDALHARSDASNHAGVSAENTGGGPALWAGGTGIIQSTANSYVFVPGGEAQLAGAPSDASLRYWARGTVDVLLSSGSNVTRTVAFPVSLPAVLYGQRVRVAGIRVYYKTSNSDTYISTSNLYREKPDGSFYTLISNPTNRTSTTFTYYDISCSEAECQLSDDEGFITVALDVYFSSSAHSINLGGVRVTLEHD